MTEPISLDEIKAKLTMAAVGHRHGQRGLFALADLPQREPVADRAINTGLPPLDEIYRLYPGQFTIVTGTPGHGKSTLVLNIVCNIARLHGWGSYLYVPENEAYLRWKLRRIYGDSPDYRRFEREQCFVQSSEVESYDAAPKSLSWVLDRAVVAVRKDNVRLLVIDPWNELEHSKPRDWTMSEYVAECLRLMKQFIRSMDVAIILVAHPTKAHASDGRKPTLYDVEQSAAWYNRCDNGLIVSRDPATEAMEVLSAKVRERGAGKRGGKATLLVNEMEQVTDLTGVVG